MSQREELRTLLNLLPRLAQLDNHLMDEACTDLNMSREALLEAIRTASALAWGEFDEGELVDIWEEDGRLRVHTGGLFEQVVRLGPQELLALHLGAAQLTASGLAADPLQLKELLRRIEESLGSPEPDLGEQLRSLVSAESDPGLDPEILEAILLAHREHRQVRIWYFSRRAERLRPRLVEPWQPFQEAGIWYVFARDRELDQQRIFRLDRVARLQTLDEEYAPPDPERLRGVCAVPLEGNLRATVRFTGAMARLAQEQQWPGLRREADGGVIQEMPYSDADALLRQLLPIAREIQILEPRELATAWLTLLKEIRARHMRKA